MSNDSGPKLQCFSLSHQESGLFDLSEALKTLKGEAIALESADILTKLGEKSILLLDLALKIEARNNHVHLTALLDEACPLLNRVATLFSDRIKEQGPKHVVIFINSLADELDLIKKLKAPSCLDVLRAVLKNIAPDSDKDLSNLMLAGVFSYDFLDHFENLSAAKIDQLELPDFLYYFPLSVISLDHQQNEMSVNAFALNNENEMAAKNRVSERLKQLKELIKNSKLKYNAQDLPKQAISKLDKNSFNVDAADEDFGLIIDKCMDHIKAGDVYQIVPSRTFSRPLDDALSSYKALRLLNPSPYMFFVRTKDWTLFGASPETFIKVDKQGSRLSIKPIAGTRRRGFSDGGKIDEELDSREQASLCLDEKELAEHMMLVDLARNDIASVARPRSRVIKRLLGVDRYSHVMHLVSEVEGHLQEDFDALSAYQASMNMGTLMGAPKVMAAELLRRLEWSKRGFYGGAVGYINAEGDMDTAIIIRSAVVKNGKAYVRAGCGVVYDSNRAFETQETLNKAEAVLKAMEIASE